MAALVFVGVICFAFGVLLGEFRGTIKMQKEAVKAGVATWEEAPDSGAAVFTYMPKSVEKN